MKVDAGSRFRQALDAEQPLQIVGAINAYSAMLAERQGFRCIYLSGSGVAAASYGLPDLGMTSLEDVLVDVRRITAATSVPLLVDIDTGWGETGSIGHTIKEMSAAGAAAVHIEDQVALKRCGHRPNKAIVTTGQMCDRIKAAVDARPDESMLIMARTDALAVEGVDSTIQRTEAFAEAGADAIFAEAMTELALYRRIVEACGVPVLANITEFGQTQLYGLDELRSAGVAMALYPLSAFRAMSMAAQNMYETIRRTGTQASAVDAMQTREELYDVLGYHKFEQESDRQIELEKNPDEER